MTQDQDWNAPGSEPAAQPDPPSVPGFPQAGAPAQEITPAGGQGMPGMAVPAGMYYDAASGLTLPNGTQLASHGRRIGAWFLAALLWIVTLWIGYAIWGLITWGSGRTPVQQLLGMRCWNTREAAVASWGTMFLRGLAMSLLDGIALCGLISFVMFLVNRDRRTLYDHLATVVVLHDPQHVLG
jgi:uncharacterized RDD family membrane protein YckC